MSSKTPKKQSRFGRSCNSSGKSKTLKLKCPDQKAAAEYDKESAMLKKTKRSMRKR